MEMYDGWYASGSTYCSRYEYKVISETGVLIDKGFTSSSNVDLIFPLTPNLLEVLKQEGKVTHWGLTYHLSLQTSFR